MTIDVGVEVDALFLDLSESGEGKYLKSAGIGEDRTIPVHKPVEAAELLDQLVAGPDMKMVGVGKLHLCPDPTKVIGGHSALDRGDSSYIHEYRRVDRAVDCLYVSPFGTSVFCQNLIFHISLALSLFSKRRSSGYFPDFFASFAAFSASFFACFSAASFFCFFVVITYHIAPVRHTEE